MKRFIFLIFLCSASYPHQSDSLNTRSPKRAALHGMIFPGAGQVYNGKWLKGAMILSLEGAAIYSWHANSEIYNNYENENNALPKHRYLEKRNKYAWWIFFVYVYGILDAMVDAHLNPFDNVMDENIESTDMKEEE